MEHLHFLCVCVCVWGGGGGGGAGKIKKTNTFFSSEMVISVVQSQFIAHGPFAQCLFT